MSAKVLVSVVKITYESANSRPSRDLRVCRKIQDPLIVLKPSASLNGNRMRHSVPSSYVKEMLWARGSVQVMIVRIWPRHTLWPVRVKEVGMGIDYLLPGRTMTEGCIGLQPER